MGNFHTGTIATLVKITDTTQTCPIPNNEISVLLHRQSSVTKTFETACDNKQRSRNHH